MEFCTKCGNLMISERKGGKLAYVCRKCGHVSKEKRVVSTNISEKIKIKDVKIPVFSEEDNLKQYPVDKKIVCMQCGNHGAYWFMQQTRSADEPPTMFLCCTKCKRKWREY